MVWMKVKRVGIGVSLAVIVLLAGGVAFRLVTTRSLSEAVSVPPILGLGTTGGTSSNGTQNKSCTGRDGQTYQPGNLEWVKNPDGTAQSGWMCDGATGQMVQLNLSASAQAPKPNGTAVPAGSGAVVSAARKKPGDNGVRCAFYNDATGEWTFYLPGDTVRSVGGNYKCGSDGHWVRTGLVGSPVGGVNAPSPIGNAGEPYPTATAGTGPLAPEPNGNGSNSSSGSNGPVTIGRKKPGGSGATCAYFNQSTGEWEYYLPGEAIQVSSSLGWHVWVTCGSDGKWTYSRAAAILGGILAPEPVGVSGGSAPAGTAVPGTVQPNGNAGNPAPSGNGVIP